MPAISSGTVSTYKIPTAPFNLESDGTAEWRDTGLLLVEIAAGEESGLGFSYTDPAAGRIAHELLSGVVTSRECFDIAAIHAQLDIHTRNMGRPGLVSSAISAIDMALWDLKARVLKVPLITLLGAVRKEIPAYGSGGFTSYSEAALIKQMTNWAENGLRSVKMKIGREPANDLARVRSVAAALQGSAELFVDANGGYSRKQALHKADEFADLGVTWFEEPVSSDDRAGLHLLVERAPSCLRIAAGEYSYTLDDARLLIEAGAVDVMQADATRCGGVTNFLKIAAVCEANHLPLSAHTAPSVHTALCCAALPAINVEYFHDHARIEKLLFDGVREPIKGDLCCDLSAPGFGLTFKHQDAEQYRF